MLRLFLTAAILVLLAITGSAQSLDRNFNGIAFAEAYDVNGRPFTEVNKNDFDGNPLLNENWGMGVVRFKNGKVLREMNLQLNLYENRLYFKQNDTIYFFLEPVIEFAFTYQDENSLPVSVVYRNGYPQEGLNHTQSFYQVLADGKNIQLLRYSYKVLVDVLNYGGPVRKKYDQKDQLYLYDASSENMIPVKKEKQFFQKALPAYASVIDSILQETKNKLRTDEDITNLVKQLNATIIPGTARH